MNSNGESLYQKRIAVGLCAWCGRPRGRSISTCLCSRCRVKARESARARMKCKPKYKDGKGYLDHRHPAMKADASKNETGG